jgi:TPR repeat protein
MTNCPAAKRVLSVGAALAVWLVLGVSAFAQGTGGPSPAAPQSRRERPDTAASAGQSKVATELVEKMRAATSAKLANDALAELKRLADRGSPSAAYWYGQTRAGSAYVTADPPTAERYLRRAADAGHPDAQYALAMLLLAGAGSSKADDPRRVEAASWLRRCEGSLPECVYMLALQRARSSGNPAAAERSVVNAAAKAGYAPAQYQAAAELLAGAPEPEKDRAAVELLERAAEQGHVLAAYDFGLLLLEGKRVGRDAVRATALLGWAASAGNARAEYALGRALLTGEGLPPEPERGLTWIRRAAVKQLPEAEYAMGFALTHGIGTGVDEVEALGWFRSAADRGYPDALFAIGNAYANGYGVGKNLTTANDWYCRAAKAGHAPALQMISRLPQGSCDRQAAKSRE